MKKTILILIVLSLFLTACGAGGKSARQSTKPPPPLKPETDFARDAIVLLTKGDLAVDDMIDWETFKVFDTDVGSKYWYMPGEAAKESFRKSFIESFASSFKNSGQSMEVLAERDGTGHAPNFARIELPAGTLPGSVLTITPTRISEGLLA